MKLRTISLPDDLDAEAAKVAQSEDRTYSNWARQVFKQALARKGDSSSREPQAFADSEKPK
jgi:hypothetical protein